MQKHAIKSVQILGLHDQQDVEAKLFPGLNIIHGINGSGKTTFLHVIANFVEGDLERFCYLNFKKILIFTYADNLFELTSSSTGNEDQQTSVRINGNLMCKVKRGEVLPDALSAKIRELVGGRPVYLPAFRTVLEAITESRPRGAASGGTEREAEMRRISNNEHQLYFSDPNNDKSLRYSTSTRDTFASIGYKTVLCREWFGVFVPIVRFPSLMEVAEQIFEEVRQAQVDVATMDREAFSDAFVKILRAVVGENASTQTVDVGTLLKSIKSSLDFFQDRDGIPKAYNEIAKIINTGKLSRQSDHALPAEVLKVYERSLKDRINSEKRAFERIRMFEQSVNRFLKGKSLDIESAHTGGLRRFFVRSKMIKLKNGHRSDLSVLSSGERHVLTILFSATHMTLPEGILLIDEPELSFHVDWQRIILGEIMKQAGQRQIIACTHAPEVTVEHRDCMIKLMMRPSN